MKHLIVVGLFLFTQIALEAQTTKAAPPSNTQSQTTTGSTAAKSSDDRESFAFANPVDGSREQTQTSYNRWTIGLTAVIALAVVLQFFGLVSQVIVYRRQTRIMDSALAVTQRSSDAFMNGDRAWVTATPSNKAPDLHPIWEDGDPYPEDPQFMNPFVHMFSATIKNVGKTPAQIEEISIKYLFRAENPVTLVEDKIHGDIVKEPSFLLVPNEESVVAAFLSPDAMLTKEQVLAIQSHRAFLYAYGIVRYKDVYDRPHETRFGYLYHFPQGGMINFETAGFRRGGPASFNGQT